MTLLYRVLTVPSTEDIKEQCNDTVDLIKLNRKEGTEYQNQNPIKRGVILTQKVHNDNILQFQLCYYC